MKRVTSFSAVVGAVLVELRLLRNQRQSDLAVAAGVAQNSWSRIERGESDLGLDQLVTVSQALGLPSDFILNVAEKLAARLRESGMTVVWHRWDVEESLRGSSAFVGVADLAVEASKLLAKKPQRQVLEGAGFRLLLATPARPGAVGGALSTAGAPIGRRARSGSTEE